MVPTYTDGPLVQVDEARNAILGTPLARGLHDAMLRGGAAYDRDTNSFVFEDPKTRTLLANAMQRMADDLSYPVAATYATAIERWYPRLGAKHVTVRDHPAIKFEYADEFSRAVKALAKLEDAVHLEPDKLIRNHNAVTVRPQLQELGVVYLPDVDAYVAMTSGKEAQIAALLDRAGIPTPLQDATIATAVRLATSDNPFAQTGAPTIIQEVLGTDLAARIASGEMQEQLYDRHQATLFIAAFTERIGPALAEAVAREYPHVVADTAATVNTAHVEQIAERAALLLTTPRDANAGDIAASEGKITESSLGALNTSTVERQMASDRNTAYETQRVPVLGPNGTITGYTLQPKTLVRNAADIAASDRDHRPVEGRPQSLQSDIFAEREQRLKTALQFLPIPEQHPKSQSLGALGVALRELHERGEATFKDWRLANRGEIVFAPVAAQNQDWIIQRTDRGVGIIHDAAILQKLITPKQRLLIEIAKEQLAGKIVKTVDQVAATETVLNAAPANRAEAEDLIAIARKALRAPLDAEFHGRYPNFKNRETPRILEDLRFPITLGTDERGNTVLEQPAVDLSRDGPDPEIAWAMGTNPGERLDAKESRAVANRDALDGRAQRASINNYINSNLHEARQVAAAEILRQGLDPSKIQYKMPEPTRLGELLTGKVIGHTRDGSHTILQLVPQPISRPPKVIIVETATLGLSRMEIGDLRKGDHLRFGFETVVDQLVPHGVQRVASPEQAAALAASRAAAGAVSVSDIPYVRVPQRIVDQAAQKYTEWHRGKTGFEPHTPAIFVDPEPGRSYSGPIVGFAGKYTIQNLGPNPQGILQIALHDIDMIARADLPFVHPDMALTLAYHQEELGQVSPINVTDARPLRDLGFAFDRDVANELYLSNPALAQTIERGLTIARSPKIEAEAQRTGGNAQAERNAVFAKWAGEEIAR